MSWLARTLGGWVSGWLGYIAAALGGQHADIVAAIIATLKAGTGAWSDVFEARYPLRRGIYPYLRVYASFDKAYRLLLSDPGIMDRAAHIAVVGMLRLPGNHNHAAVEDAMDALAEQIEIALTSAKLRLQMEGFEQLNLLTTDFAVIERDDGVLSHAEVTLTWRVTYAEQEGIPAVLV